MSFSAIGDMVQHFQLQRQNTSLKSGLNQAANELGTGRIADVTAHLRGETQRLSGINHSISILESYVDAGREVAFFLDVTQKSLAGIDAKRDAMSRNLLLVSQDSSIPVLEEAGRNARTGFNELVESLNQQYANRSIYAGNAVDRPAMAPPADILAGIVTSIGGATDDISIIAAVDAWFDTPGGGFETVGYLGDTGAASNRRLNDKTIISLDARADAPAIRATLKAAAIAALSGELAGLDQVTRGKLVFAGAVQLQSAASGLVQLQSRVGYSEGEVERASVQTASQLNGLNISRNEMVLADPFESATRLQAIQLQLETHYTMTARVSQLSLVGYLR